MPDLVTGANGFAGQHLLKRLLEGGREIVGTTLDGAAPVPGTLGPAERSRVRWIPLDVTDPVAVGRAVEEYRPERVYHLAGQSSVGRSFADPLGTWTVNATGTLHLVDALRRSGAARAPRVLLISSAEVYGTVPEEEQPIPEARPLRPSTPYGASKAAAEVAALQAGRQGGVEVVVARSFNHVGPGQDERFVLPSMARQLRSMASSGASDRVLRVGNLEARRDFLDVRDVVRAYEVMMERGESGGVYNVCSGEAYLLSEVVEALVELSGTDARIQVDPERVRPVDIPRLQGDPSRLRGLGWEAEIPLRRSLRDLLAEAE